MRVLVVEDQWLIATDLSLALQAAGHEVVGPALDSAHALALGASEDPQLALIDIDLEKRGIGLEVAERLYRQHGTPVIFMTGQAELARKCRYGLGLINKPYDATQAAAAVNVVEAILRDGSELCDVPENLEVLAAWHAVGTRLNARVRGR